MVLKGFLFFSLIVFINAKALKIPHLLLSPTANAVESKELHSTSTMKTVYDNQQQAVSATPPASSIDILQTTSDNPTIENRVAIQVPSCPIGYERVNEFCVKEDFELE